jgi:hypothetical protein
VKNPGKSIREAYMTALQGLTYDGKAVQVYEFMPIETLPDNYVYINAITYNQTGNNQLFIYTAGVAIDIVTKQYKKLDYDVVDGIAEQVQTAILAFPYSQIQDSNFGFMNTVLESAQYIIEQDGSAFIVRKIIRFTQSLIQK